MEECNNGSRSKMTPADIAEINLNINDPAKAGLNKEIMISASSQKKKSHAVLLQSVTARSPCRVAPRNTSADSLSSAASDDSDRLDDASKAQDLKGEKESSQAGLDAVEALMRLTEKQVFDICANHSHVASFIHSRIQNGSEKNSFLVTNLASVISQYEQWREELPMVHPFYAVKCNPDPTILKTLASLGCGFDCATMGEIDLVVNGIGQDLSFGPRGLAHDHIVYANPAKMEHMLDFAVENNVRMTVFDGEDELHKIAGLKSNANLQLLLRLTTDDQASICRFSKKFGCPVADAPHLLKVAQSLGLDVAGVSFHVGSGCGDANAYITALRDARAVFEAAEALDMPAMHIIDIGGGFPGETAEIIEANAAVYGGSDMPSFKQLARAIRAGIAEMCTSLDRPAESIRFIAEPGRYFVSACTTIASRVFSRKGGRDAHQALYIDDGVYGSFNNVVYDHVVPVPQKLAHVMEGEAHQADHIPTAVFGPTCDGLDQLCALDNTTMPRCAVGDWLIFDNMGAYTHTASFVFNGYTHVPTKTYCYF